MWRKKKTRCASINVNTARRPNSKATFSCPVGSVTSSDSSSVGSYPHANYETDSGHSTQLDSHSNSSVEVGVGSANSPPVQHRRYTVMQGRWWINHLRWGFSVEVLFSVYSILISPSKPIFINIEIHSHNVTCVLD